MEFQHQKVKIKSKLILKNKKCWIIKKNYKNKLSKKTMKKKD